jgi:hypothetical protein
MSEGGAEKCELTVALLGRILAQSRTPRVALVQSCTNISRARIVSSATSDMNEGGAKVCEQLYSYGKRCSIYASLSIAHSRTPRASSREVVESHIPRLARPSSKLIPL